MKKIILIVIGLVMIITSYTQQPKKRKDAVAVSGAWTWTVTDTIKSVTGGSYETVATWTWAGISTDTPIIHVNGKNLKFIATSTAKNNFTEDVNKLGKPSIK